MRIALHHVMSRETVVKRSGHYYVYARAFLRLCVRCVRVLLIVLTQKTQRHTKHTIGDAEDEGDNGTSATNDRFVVNACAKHIRGP